MFNVFLLIGTTHFEHFKVRFFYEQYIASLF